MSDYERERLFTLRKLKILDTPPSESFDRITRTASKLFDLPLSAVSLSDENRQWFKSRVGTDMTEITREKTPCTEISASSETRVVEDFLADDYYKDSPLAQLGLRFYAGAPLTTEDGYTLGSLCVLGTEPRKASDEEMEALVDLSQMVMAQIELQYIVGRVDPLTLLPNRLQFTEDLSDLAKDHKNGKRYIIFVELAGARELNTLNRIKGGGNTEELAREATRTLQAKLDTEDKLYSVGTCQFLVLCRPESERKVEAKANHLHLRLDRINRGSTRTIIVRPVIGIAAVHLGQTKADDAIRQAHSASHDARQWERAWSTYDPVIDADHQRQFRLLQDMRTALTMDEGLRLVFQPRIDLVSGTCTGAEALLRWQHPDLGEISPSEFIPLIENTPLARHLTRWVLDAATAQAAAWFRQGKSLRVSANVMASNFEEDHFVERLEKRMRQLDLPAPALELELTESALVRNRITVARQLNALSNAGIHLAIDDFGTGYSSLAYLLNIPATVIKIDRIFTAKSPAVRPTSQKTLLKAMIDLAHGMGFRTVAEGYEPAEMLQTLNQFGCDEVQSFAISRPLEPDRFESWLDTFTPDSVNLRVANPI